MESTHLTDQEVDHIAHLARLEITAEERSQFRRQLGAILDYVDQLQGLDTEGLEATLGVQPASNVFREDVERAGMPREQVLANAPWAFEGAFRIPRILDEESA